MTIRSILVGFALLLLLAPALLAERPDLGPRMLDGEATHVLVGDVKAVYSRDVVYGQPGRRGVDTHYLVELEVAEVEKGVGFAKKDLAYIRCWQRTKSPPTPTPGASGHGPVPKAGDRVRAYVARGEYGPTRQADNGLAAVYPNGFVVLGASPASTGRAAPTSPAAPSSPRGRVLTVTADATTVVISLGAEDGVRMGSRYTIARRASYVAVVEVTSVQAKQSTARVIPSLQKSPVQAGDLVVQL